MYISSADLMTRNTEKRVEIATPVLDEEIRNRILNYLEIQMQDNVGARTMNSDGEYEKIEIQGERISCQDYFIKKCEEKNFAERSKVEKTTIDKEKVEDEKNNKKNSFFGKLLKIFKK